jgi:uncharacterized protein (TIGR02145 family)
MATLAHTSHSRPSTLQQPTKEFIMNRVKHSLFTAIFIVTAFTQSFAREKGSFTDARDKKTYKIVKIGSQTWMAENLDYTVEGGRCYDDKPANCAKYGRLYDWVTAMNVCPSGWRLPSKEDWDIFMNFVQTDNGSTYTSGSSSLASASIAGKYLKATSGWENNEGQSGSGEDKYGFAVLPGGGGHFDGDFFEVGYIGLWWSSSESGSNYAYRGYMGYDHDNASRHYDVKHSLFSVRCVKN